jgi:hypothetical protein
MLIGLHLIGATGMYLIGVHLVGVHLVGAYHIGVHFRGCRTYIPIEQATRPAGVFCGMIRWCGKEAVLDCYCNTRSENSYYTSSCEARSAMPLSSWVSSRNAANPSIIFVSPQGSITSFIVLASSSRSALMAAASSSLPIPVKHSSRSSMYLMVPGSLQPISRAYAWRRCR